MKTIPGAEPLRLLALMAPGDFMANTPLEFLLEGSSVALKSFYLPAQDALPSSLPDHDVTFVAIAESDENRPILETLATLAADWPRPLINAPGLIARLTRDGFAKLMQGAPGAMVPPVRRIERNDLCDAGRTRGIRLSDHSAPRWLSRRRRIEKNRQRLRPRTLSPMRSSATIITSRLLWITATLTGFSGNIGLS